MVKKLTPLNPTAWSINIYTASEIYCSQYLGDRYLFKFLLNLNPCDFWSRRLAVELISAYITDESVKSIKLSTSKIIISSLSVLLK